MSCFGAVLLERSHQIRVSETERGLFCTAKGRRQLPQGALPLRSQPLLQEILTQQPGQINLHKHLQIEPTCFWAASRDMKNNQLQAHS